MVRFDSYWMSTLAAEIEDKIEDKDFEDNSEHDAIPSWWSACKRAR